MSIGYILYTLVKIRGIRRIQYYSMMSYTFLKREQFFQTEYSVKIQTATNYENYHSSSMYGIF